MLRMIAVGKRTAKHAETLKEKGYEVKEQDGVLAVQCAGVVEGEIDLSTPEKAKEILTQVVKDKKVFSYGTKFNFGDKVLWGVMACTRLGRASALVTKGEKEVKKTSALDDVFAAL